MQEAQSRSTAADGLIYRHGCMGPKCCTTVLIFTVLGAQSNIDALRELLRALKCLFLWDGAGTGIGARYILYLVYL
jgi:hypothetical protein